MAARRDAVQLLVAGALLVALLLAAPLLPSPRSETTFRLAAYGSHTLYYATLVAAVAIVARWWPARLRSILLACAATFVVAMACNVADVDVASDVAKVAFGSLAGIAFVRAIERPWWLLPIAVTVPLADAWSVFSARGVTHAVIERAQEEPRWIDWPTIATPIAGFPYDLFGRLGTVDVLFTALFLAAARRWDLGLRRACVALVVGLLATSVLVFEQSSVAVPALPLLCVAFLVACSVALLRDARAAMRG